MRTATLAGTHTLPDGSKAEVIITGRSAEIRGSRNGDATYTVRVPVSRARELLAGAVR